MTKPTLLESFCLLAEAQQTAYEIGLSDAGRSTAVSIDDMIRLIAEIRALQGRAAEHGRIAQDLREELQAVRNLVALFKPYGTPDGKVNIVLEEGAKANCVETGSGYTFGGPMRIIGKLARVQSDPAPAPAADADGWIEWGGSDSPPVSDQPVDVKFRDGITFTCNDPSDFYWRHIDSSGDIVAYRLHRSEKPLPVDADGFHPANTKPATPGIYRTWFLKEYAGGFSHWNGDAWSNEYKSPERTLELVNVDRQSAVQEKHWKPL